MEGLRRKLLAEGLKRGARKRKSEGDMVEYWIW